MYTVGNMQLLSLYAQGVVCFRGMSFYVHHLNAYLHIILIFDFLLLLLKLTEILD
jgi:hypothetical protein